MREQEKRVCRLCRLTPNEGDPVLDDFSQIVEWVKHLQRVQESTDYVPEEKKEKTPIRPDEATSFSGVSEIRNAMPESRENLCAVPRVVKR